MPYQSKTTTMALGQVKKFGVNFRNQFNQTPLMIAVWLGNTPLVKALVDYEPKTDLVDNNQHNALQIAFSQASHNKTYAQTNLKTMYYALQPDSLSIQVDGRLVKLGNHLMEFILLNLLIAIFYRVMPLKILQGGSFQAKDILEAIEYFSKDVLPTRRKKQSYISSILANNEVDRAYRYNRKLFKRLKLGHYIFNPSLALKIEGEWVNIYQICQLDKLHFYPETATSWWNNTEDERLNQSLAKSVERFKRLIDPNSQR
jgi:hypothetical protein